MSTLQSGATYRVTSTRKGKFTGIVTSFDDTWAEILITDGKAKAMMEYNEREQGETVTVRRSFCTFELIGSAS